MKTSEIAVVATGGTIACEADDSGALVPRRTAAQLIESAGVHVPCRPVDVRALDSSSMALADVDALVATVHEQLADPSVAGVVVTHGTDSLTETAFALDLFHSDPRPVLSQVHNAPPTRRTPTGRATSVPLSITSFPAVT